MLKNNKRKLIIIITSILIVVFISTNFILLKYFYIQKKQMNSNLILENVDISSWTKKNDVAQILKSQYKSSNWRLIIEKINLDAPIIEGTTTEVLRRGVGHFESSSKLEGNVCLAAHNRGYKYNYFQEIKKLENGDIITYKTGQETKKYEVTRNKVIKETDWSCLENTKENTITLITCEENKRECRRCVQGKEIY